jgi:tetratricopeptide (TPR) repeat protein
MVLQRYRYLLNKSFTVNSDYSLDFLEKVLGFLENEGKKYLENRTLSLLYRQIKLLKNPESEELFYEIKKELLNDTTPIEDFDRRDGLTILSNLCIEKAYSGKEEFYNIIFEIDKYLVEKSLYNRIKGGYFEKEMFMNIIAIALKLGQFDWAADFIENNVKKLHPDIAENIRNYSYARLYSKEGNFEKARNYISKVIYTDVHIKINARITKAIIEYELGNIEEVLNEIENFRKYVQNDKLLSKGNRKISSNFIKFVSKLCKARYSFKQNLNELKKEIINCDMVNSRQWLIDKTDELMQRRN